MVENRPKVSVVMITYAHKKFIEEAINGVLMQQCDFDVELILANDCSPDNTDEIVLDILKRHPNASWIRYIKHEKNIGMMPNFIFAMEQCKGKYIALCEGDDYWTDKNKLQKQVDFLEANKDFAICFHNMQVIYDDETKAHFSNPSNQKAVSTIEDLANGNYIYTASCIFRNGLIAAFPEWYRNSPVGDYVLHMLNAKFGKIKYLPEVMGVYRSHKKGVWSTKTDFGNYYKWIQLIELMRDEFEPEVQILLNQQIILSIRILLNEENNILPLNIANELTSKAFNLMPNAYQHEIKLNFTTKKELEKHHSIKFLSLTLIKEIADRINIKGIFFKKSNSSQ